MPDTIKIMLSSTIKDMVAERDAVIKEFAKYPFVELIGAEPIEGVSQAVSPYIATLDMARSCDFYLLMLGERYGYEIRKNTSATEAEFDEAYKENPTKILVFKKNGITPEKKQKKFIDKVGDYYHGYWISKFTYTHDLQCLVGNTFLEMLRQRASIGYRLNYFDHFIRIAIQRIPYPDTKILYSVKEAEIELIYNFFGKDHIIHFAKDEVHSDFWGCISTLEKKFVEWR